MGWRSRLQCFLVEKQHYLLDEFLVLWLQLSVHAVQVRAIDSACLCQPQVSLLSAVLLELSSLQRTYPVALRAYELMEMQQLQVWCQRFLVVYLLKELLLHEEVTSCVLETPHELA